MALDVLIITLLGTVVFTLSITFLPALIELIIPRDAGPRLISRNIALTCLSGLANMEEDLPFNEQFAKFFIVSLPAISSLEH